MAASIPREGSRRPGPDAGTVARLRAMEPELRRLGIAGLSLFGSMARGASRPTSDVDLLLSLEPGRSFDLLDMSNVRLLLTDRLGRETTVLIGEDLTPDFRARIADDLVPIF